MRSKVAFALHRLCAVLSEGWLKQDRDELEANQKRNNISPPTSISDKNAAALEAAFGPLAGSSLSRQNSLTGIVEKPPPGGPISRTNSGTNAGTSSRRRRSGTGAKPPDALTDISRTMEMVTRLMLAVCGATPSNDAASSASSFMGTDRHSNAPSAANSRPGSMKLSGSGFGGTVNLSAVADSLSSSRNSSDFSSGLWSLQKDIIDKEGRGAGGPSQTSNGATEIPPRVPIPANTPGIAYTDSERNSLMSQSAKIGSISSVNSSGARPQVRRETSWGINSSSGGGVESDIVCIEPAEIICCEALVLLSRYLSVARFLSAGMLLFPFYSDGWKCVPLCLQRS